jgi:hypothetical protein
VLFQQERVVCANESVWYAKKNKKKLPRKFIGILKNHFLKLVLSPQSKVVNIQIKK